MIKISDEDIMSFVKESFEKEAKERGLVQEQEEFDDTCGDIRNFPKFEINPNWGRTGKSGNQLAETEMVRGMFASIDRVQGRDEVGDVYTMIEIMHDFDIISWNDIEERVKQKRKKLSKWSDLLEPWQVEGE